MITLVAVIGPKGELGAGDRLLYSLRDDMRHFKEYTMGHPIVMGRKTYGSFPKRPLPGRTNIVITRNAGYPLPQGVLRAGSVDSALEQAAHCDGGDNIMVIGGGEIYRQSIDRATDLELTVVEVAPGVEADTFFPDIDTTRWRLTNPDTPLLHDSRSGIPYRLLHYTRF